MPVILVDRVVDKKRIIGKMEGRGGGEAQGVTQYTKIRTMWSPCWPGLPDFSWYIIPKREKYTKSPKSIPNGLRIYQKAVKYNKSP
jgi:hypothetical protein